jgi:hypothetical protein
MTWGRIECLGAARSQWRSAIATDVGSRPYDDQAGGLRVSNGLVNPLSAEIHLVTNDHGPLLPEIAVR